MIEQCACGKPKHEGSFPYSIEWPQLTCIGPDGAFKTAAEYLEHLRKLPVTLVYKDNAFFKYCMDCAEDLAG